MKRQEAGGRKGKLFFLNGRFVSKEEALVSVLDPGFLYGWGIFETMRAYNRNIVYLDQHLERLKKSAAIIRLSFPYPVTKIKSIIFKTVELNRIKDSYLRLSLWKGEKKSNLSIIVKPYAGPTAVKYKQGFRIGVSDLRQNQSSPLSRVKSFNYLFYQLVYRQAKARGFDEGLILNSHGYLSEASRSNLFFVKDNQLFTPALGCGCLEGVTRRAVLDFSRKYNVKVCQGNFILRNLFAADEAFLTNSLIGIMPLVSIEKHPIGKGIRNFSLTKLFVNQYDHLLKK